MLRKAIEQLLLLKEVIDPSAVSFRSLLQLITGSNNLMYLRHNFLL
jgi:hypothetical protein